MNHFINKCCINGSYLKYYLQRLFSDNNKIIYYFKLIIYVHCCKVGCYISNALHELTSQVGWPMANTNVIQKDA